MNNDIESVDHSTVKLHQPNLTVGKVYTAKKTYEPVEHDKEV